MAIENLRTPMLIGTCLILGGMLLWALTTNLEPASQQSAMQDPLGSAMFKPKVAVPTKVERLHKLTTYSHTLNAPLFSSSRTRPQPVEQHVRPTVRDVKQFDPDKHVLRGIVGSADGHILLLENKTTRKIMRISEQDNSTNWTILTVTNNSATLAQGTNKVTLILRKQTANGADNNVKPSPATPRQKDPESHSLSPEEAAKQFKEKLTVPM